MKATEATELVKSWVESQEVLFKEELETVYKQIKEAATEKGKTKINITVPEDFADKIYSVLSDNGFNVYKESFCLHGRVDLTISWPNPVFVVQG